MTILTSSTSRENQMTRTAVITGLGAAVPPNVVTNDMLAERMDTSDEWIFTRTGIRQRHVIDPGSATSDLAVEAGSKALKSAALAGVEDVDMVIVATTTPDHPCPATAPDVASRLGLGTVAAFDVAAVCSGFVYGLGIGSAAITGGLAERVLVIGAETFSTILNPQDRTTGVIFGDGAGAVVLRPGTPDEPGAISALDLGSDGRLRELIIVEAGGSRQRSTGLPPAEADSYFAMQGAVVFRTAVQRMAESVTTTLSRAGWPLDSLDWLVGHQANVRILHTLADLLRLPREQAVVNIDRVGNTSAASIPLALADAAAANTFAVGDRIALTAFGGGVTWGSATFTWPDITVV